MVIHHHESLLTYQGHFQFTSWTLAFVLMMRDFVACVRTCNLLKNECASMLIRDALSVNSMSEIGSSSVYNLIAKPLSVAPTSPNWHHDIMALSKSLLVLGTRLIHWICLPLLEFIQHFMSLFLNPSWALMQFLPQCFRRCLILALFLGHPRQFCSVGCSNAITVRSPAGLSNGWDSQNMMQAGMM